MTPSTAGVAPGRFFRLPRSRTGWVSVEFSVLFGLVLAFFMWVASPDASRVLLVVLALATVAMGVAALGSGVAAVLRRGERSWLVWLAMLPGIVVILWVGTEILFPH